MAFTQLPTGGGVPNVDLITQTLAKLQPDSALQQYAAMHKNDPYILSLATAESNRRKALRLAAQGQNAGRQPTVADQNIAGMAPAPVMTGSGGTLQTGYGGPVTTGMAAGGLPEDQGIAQLPTPNMQRMADGGIAGYEDDEEGMATGGMGGMFNFAQQSEPVVRMSGGGHVPRYQGVPTSMGGDGSVVKSSIQQIEDANIAELSPLAQQFKTAEQQFIAAAKSGDQVAIAQYMQVKEDLRKQLEQAVSSKFGNAAPKVLSQLLSPEKPAAPTAPVTPAIPASQKTPAVAPNASAAAPPPPPPGAKPPPSLPPSPGAAPASQAKLPTGIETLKEPTAADATAVSDKFFDADALTRRLEQQRLQERQDIATEATTRGEKQAAFSKEQGPAMAGYAKLLDSEEKQDVSDKEKAGLMALFKGFLGIAAGESPNAATNIAKGSMVGLEDYNSALKDLKKSAKERNKERAFIENAQRAEGREDFRSQQSFEDKANDASRAADRAFTSAITQVTGKKGEIASGIYKDMVGSYDAFKRTMYTGDVQERVANIQAGATRYSADKRSTDQKDMMESIRGGQLVETAMKNLREQINKSDKYGTQADKDAAFEKLWPQVLQMNPNLAKYAGTIGGGGAPAGGADFVLNVQTGKLEPRK
jgi:hypothetical protein